MLSPAAQTAPVPPAGTTPPPGAVSFEATAEGGVIRVPADVRAKLGPTFRATVTVPATVLEPAPSPAPAALPPGIPDYVDPAVAAAHPNWEWASAEKMAAIRADLRRLDASFDLGDLEGTPMGDLMRNPLPTPAGGFLTREEANTDPHRNRGVPASATVAGGVDN